MADSPSRHQAQCDGKRFALTAYGHHLEICVGDHGLILEVSFGCPAATGVKERNRML